MSHGKKSDLDERLRIEEAARRQRDLTEEIQRTIKAFAAGEIGEEDLTEWVDSWVARAKRQLG